MPTKSLEEIARKATEYNPKHRYRNVKEMLEDLNPPKKPASKRGVVNYTGLARGVKKRVAGLITNLRRKEETKKEEPNEELLERKRLIRKLKEYFVCLERGWLNVYSLNEESLLVIDGTEIIYLPQTNRERSAIKDLTDTLDMIKVDLDSQYLLRVVWELGRVSGNNSSHLSEAASDVLRAYSRMKTRKGGLDSEIFFNIVQNNVEIYAGCVSPKVNEASKRIIREMQARNRSLLWKKNPLSRIPKWALATMGSLFFGGVVATALYTQTPDYRLSQYKQDFRTIQQLVEKGEYEKADEITDRLALKRVKESDSRVKELLIEIGEYDKENIGLKIGCYFITKGRNEKGEERITKLGYKKGQRQEVLLSGDIETCELSPNDDLTALISNRKLYLARFYGRDSTGFPKDLFIERQRFDFEETFTDTVFSDLSWRDNHRIRFSVHERGHPETKSICEMDIDKNEYSTVTE